MPIYLDLLSMDEAFKSVPSPIIINDLPSRTEEDRDYFNALVNQTFTSDIISMIPQCAQGHMKGEHLVGQICEICNTPVKQSIEDDVTPSVWFRKPQGVEKLINPIVWIMLSKRFVRSKFKIMNWLIDRHYRPSIKVPDIVYKMEAAGIPRGYNNFVNHFDEILEWLFNCGEFKVKSNSVSMVLDMLKITHPSKDPLQQLLQRDRDKIFSDYLPIPNRSLLVIERNVMGTFADATIFGIKNVLNTMLSIDRDFYDKTPSVIENRTAKIITMLGDYYYTYFHKNLSPKEGLLRKNDYGARLNHAFRCVITSHEALHHHEELWIPWSVALVVFRLHIKNRLMNRHHPLGGLTNNEADALIYGHIGKYHERLDLILKDLILKAQKKYRGIPCLLHRN